MSCLRIYERFVPIAGGRLGTLADSAPILFANREVQAIATPPAITIAKGDLEFSLIIKTKAVSKDTGVLLTATSGTQSATAELFLGP